MAAKRPTASEINRTLYRLIKETCSSYNQITGEPPPSALARDIVFRVWNEQWPHYVACQLATVLGLDQIVELNGSTQHGQPEPVAEADDDEAD